MDCIIYARVSSKEQAEGFSIPAQLDLLRTYSRNKGLRIVQEFTEAETAKSAGREKFNEMLAWLKKQKKPISLLVEKTDRLYRNFSDYVSLEDLIAAGSLAVHLVKESEILDRDARSHLKFIHGIKVLMAKNYIDNLSEEVKKGQAEAVKQGRFPWLAPYGYINKEKRIEPHPDQARYVQAAFSVYSTGYSLQSTSNRLYEMGLTYKNYQPKIGRSKLNDLLKSRVYIGEVPYNGMYYKGVHQPLIDMDTWNQCQMLLRKINKPLKFSRRHFLYRGIAYCGECGGAFVGETKKGRYVYYRCVDKKSKCTQGYIRESIIDKALQASMGRLILSDKVRRELLDAVKGMEAVAENTYREESDRIEGEIERLRAKVRHAYHDKLDGMIESDMYLEISHTSHRQIDELTARKAALLHTDINYYETADRMVELPKMIADSWSSANNDEKIFLLQTFCSNFIIKDGKVSLELKDPFNDILVLGSSNEWRSTPDILRTILQKHAVVINRLYEAA